jgi:TetR/AcrR family transcriptional regulator, transcriptional repressor of bet genes
MNRQGEGIMRRKTAPEEVRREQILRAAFEVAAREGIAGLTVRAVAGEAEISHALILFHFKRKERLIQELLDWLIATTAALDVSDDVAGLPRALDRLHALLQQEVDRLVREPGRVRLFFEFWALSARDAQIRATIGAELERYRAAFRSIMEELMRAEPATFAEATAEGMAAVAVSWIHGCAVQAMNDPAHFDTAEYLAAVRTIVGQLARGE